MAINKVVYGNTALIDLTSDTIVAKCAVNTRTGHLADGTTFTGTIPWRFVVQETLVCLDNESVNGSTIISDVGSITGTTLIL